MAKEWKPKKTTVELRPSRIRREPAPAAESAEPEKKLKWSSSEREIYLALIGIIAFAIAINIITVAVSAYTN